eukprot:Rhum_TRINITY_DN8738_c0_g1::Rhum_TRINITY_DN8738_c0_g1_i2::g.29501::m.29501
MSQFHIVTPSQGVVVLMIMIVVVAVVESMPVRALLRRELRVGRAVRAPARVALRRRRLRAALVQLVPVRDLLPAEAAVRRARAVVVVVVPVVVPVLAAVVHAVPVQRLVRRELRVGHAARAAPGRPLVRAARAAPAAIPADRVVLVAVAADLVAEPLVRRGRLRLPVVRGAPRAPALVELVPVSHLPPRELVVRDAGAAALALSVALPVAVSVLAALVHAVLVVPLLRGELGVRAAAGAASVVSLVFVLLAPAARALDGVELVVVAADLAAQLLVRRQRLRVARRVVVLGHVLAAALVQLVAVRRLPLPQPLQRRARAVVVVVVPVVVPVLAAVVHAVPVQRLVRREARVRAALRGARRRVATLAALPAARALHGVEVEAVPADLRRHLLVRRVRQVVGAVAAPTRGGRRVQRRHVFADLLRQAAARLVVRRARQLLARRRGRAVAGRRRLDVGEVASLVVSELVVRDAVAVGAPVGGRAVAGDGAERHVGGVHALGAGKLR